MEVPPEEQGDYKFTYEGDTLKPDKSCAEQSFCIEDADTYKGAPLFLIDLIRLLPGGSFRSPS